MVEHLVCEAGARWSQPKLYARRVNERRQSKEPLEARQHRRSGGGCRTTRGSGGGIDVPATSSSGGFQTKVRFSQVPKNSEPWTCSCGKKLLETEVSFPLANCG